MASRDVSFWKEAIQSEIDSIMHNDTWELTELPPGCKALGCKWILKRKMKVDGSIDKYKARLVIQGFRQKEGIDFVDTYAPVARISTIRLLLALAAIHDLVIHQMDVKTAFLNESVKEMTSKFDKLAKFEGQDFRRWQKKMHFLLTTLKVVYVLSTPSPEWSENENMETTRKRMKWENDDYICRGHILNVHHSGYFTSPLDRRYTNAVVDWIPKKSFDEGLTPLTSDEDVLSLLWHAPKYREIEVYVDNGISLVKKKMMEVSLAKGKGVLVEEIFEDDDVENENEASTSVAPPLVATDAQVVPVDALVVHVDGPVIALKEDIQRPRKRKKRYEI
uniref:Zinc finger, CCHC-type n=1 Tax=Tanacetum cinerariifolium TaxID=118510 RepID=A0A6L2LFG9_TANCI|nr:zinc finger, CCHC-type [Tanacetum cinerariifolium]